MKLTLGKLLKKTVRKSPGTKNLNKKIIHLPDDLLDSNGFLLLAGSLESNVWPVVYMANTLQREFPEKNLTVICSSRDSRLFNMLRIRPSVHVYTGRPEIPDSIEGKSFTEKTLLIYPYANVHSEMERILCRTHCGIRMAPLNHSSPYINFRVKTESVVYPDILSQMCGAVGIKYDVNWRPSLTKKLEKAAERMMAPVSGRMLPYIVTTSSAISILEKSRAEIPLRTILLSGKNSEFSKIDRDMKTAIIADASAVVTDSDDLWGDACAFGIPAVGLDKSDSFIKWSDREPASNESDFVESWVKLLKKGW
jgi:hypothetical protein